MSNRAPSPGAIASGCTLAAIGLTLRVAAYVVAWPLLADLFRLRWWIGIGAGLALWAACRAIAPILPARDG